MVDLTIMSSELLRSIRGIKQENEVTKYINTAISNLRARGYSDMELANLIQQMHSQLHTLDPLSIEDSHEWNMITHAKVELFRIGSKMISPEG